MKLSKILFLIAFAIVVFSCKKAPKSISKELTESAVTKISKETSEEAVEGVSKKALKKISWEELLDIIRKDNMPLANSLSALEKNTQKEITKAIRNDARFFKSLLSSRTIVDEFSVFTKESPKLSENINFMKMFVNSKYEAKRYGAKDIFDEISLGEKNGFVSFLKNNVEIAKYRDGVIDISNNIIGRNGRFTDYTLLKGELLPNSVYKVRGKDGLLYLFNIDDLGRVSSIKARLVSPDDISSNILNLKNDIYLGSEWDVALKKLKEISNGNDVDLNIVYKYSDDGSTPMFATIQAKINNKTKISQTFENIDKTFGRKYSVADNISILTKWAKNTGMSPEKQDRLLQEMNADEELSSLIHKNPEFNIRRWLNTRKHVDKSKIVKTASGRMPPNAGVYAGNVYYFNPHLNSGLNARLKKGEGLVKLKKTTNLTYDELIKLDRMYPDGVPFGTEGYPDFSKVAFKDRSGNPMRINIGELSGYSERDINKAETLFQKLGYPWRDGFTWHHEENSTNLLRVPTVIHQLVDHAGGMSTSHL